MGGLKDWHWRFPGMFEALGVIFVCFQAPNRHSTVYVVHSFVVVRTIVASFVCALNRVDNASLTAPVWKRSALFILFAELKTRQRKSTRNVVFCNRFCRNRSACVKSSRKLQAWESQLHFRLVKVSNVYKLRPYHPTEGLRRGAI